MADKRTVKRTLRRFYKEVLAWIAEGCPSPGYYEEGLWASCGLCSNLADWLFVNVEDADLRKAVREAQGVAFVAAFGTADYPFNPPTARTSSASSYLTEAQDKAIYTNPQRLLWIIKGAA